MYAQAAIKSNTLLRNGAYGIVMRGVQKCTRGCSSLRGRNRLPLCCIKLDTATDLVIGSGTYIDNFEEQLIGAHPGDKVEVTVVFPDDYQAADLAGKEAVLDVTVNGIYE